MKGGLPAFMFQHMSIPRISAPKGHIPLQASGFPEINDIIPGTFFPLSVPAEITEDILKILSHEQCLKSPSQKGRAVSKFNIL